VRPRPGRWITPASARSVTAREKLSGAIPRARANFLEETGRDRIVVGPRSPPRNRAAKAAATRGSPPRADVWNKGGLPYPEEPALPRPALYFQEYLTIGALGSAAHSCVDPSYTLTFW
jgi:hypothetical protein